MTRVAILISGRGSNMEALVRSAGAVFEVALVLSDVADAPGLAAARDAGVRTRAVPHRAFGRDRPAHEAAVDAALREAGAELVCLAGYMRLLTPLLVDRWAGRMLNVHPSLLPAFPGLHTHERALEAGVKLHGCTVHLVTQGVDDGPILAQAAVPVLPGDDAASLAARVLAQEHRIYPAAVTAFVRGEAGWPAASASLACPLPAVAGLPYNQRERGPAT